MDECEYEVELSGSGEVAASLPHLLGFRPQESAVVVGLGGASGGRVGLAVRVDLPPPQRAEALTEALAEALAGALARGILTDRPAAVVLAVVSEAPDEPGAAGDPDLPYRRLVHAVVVTLAATGIPVREALLVRGGRWWSYECPDPCCAPAAGTRLPEGVSELEVASIATGRVLAQSREELAARLHDLDAVDRAAVRQAVVTVSGDRHAKAREAGWATVEDEAWAAIQVAVAERRPGASAPVPRLPAEEVARMTWGLRHATVRDRALGLCLRYPDAAEALWTELTRRSPGVLRSAPATLLAVSAWLRGDGAMAGVALDHALDCDGDCRLAQLLRSALAACMRPDELRDMILATLTRLDAVRPAG